MALIQHNTLQDNAANGTVAAAVGFAGVSQGGDTENMRIVGPGGSYPYGLTFLPVNPDFIYLAQVIALAPVSTWSISARIKRTDMDGYNAICGDGQSLEGSGMAWIGFPDGGYQLQIIDDVGNGTSIILDSYLSNNVWATLGITNDGNESGESYKIYVNGVLRGSIPALESGLYIDTIGFGNTADIGPLWKGGLSDFRIYNTELNAAAMLAIHNEGVTATPGMTNPLVETISPIFSPVSNPTDIQPYHLARPNF